VSKESLQGRKLCLQSQLAAECILSQLERLLRYYGEYKATGLEKAPLEVYYRPWSKLKINRLAFFVSNATKYSMHDSSRPSTTVQST
jgi:hypothetical protein